MYGLMLKDQACRYRLFCDGETFTLSVDSRYRDVIAKATAPEQFVDQEAYSRKKLKLKAFERELDTSGRWGFGGVLEILSKPEDPTIGFKASIPVVQKEGDIDWVESFHICHSFEILFSLLGYAAVVPSGVGNQSSLVMLGTWEGIHGGIVAADVSPAMVAWLVDSFDRRIQDGVHEVMLKTNRRMMPEWKHHAGVECYMSHNTLQMKSGGAGSLGVIGCREADPGCGFELHPHNCDTPLDQMVFLAGLAKLDEFFHQR